MGILPVKQILICFYYNSMTGKTTFYEQ